MASEDTTSTSFADETSIGGIKYVGDRESAGFRRFLWLLIVLGAATALGIQCHKIVTTFMMRPVSINIERLEVPSMPFPALTFCNNNLVRKSVLAENTGFLNLEISQQVAQTIFSREYMGIERYTDLDYRGADYGVQFGSNLLGYMEAVAHKPEDAILWCRWRGENCGPENFTKTVTNYGVCFTFNSGESGEVHYEYSSGERHGLMVYLNVELADYISGPRDTVGFKAMVHDQGDVPNIEDLGFALSPGTHTLVALAPKKEELLPEPKGHSKCITKTKARMKYFDGDYSRSKCNIECVTSYILDKCGCRYFYMPGEARYCLPEELGNCYFEAIEDLSTNSSLCTHCQDACHLVSYDVSLSYQSFPSFPVVRDLNRNGAVVCRNAYTDYFRMAIPDDHYIPCLLATDLQSILTLLSTQLRYYGHNASKGIQYEYMSGLLNATLPVFYEKIYHELNLIVTLIMYQDAYDMVNENDTSDLTVGGDIYNRTYDAAYEHLIHRKWYEILLSRSIPATIEDSQVFQGNKTIDSAATSGVLLVTFMKAYDEIFDSIYDSYRDCFEERFASLLETMSGEDICFLHVRQNVVKVNVYFEDMVVDIITQRADYQVFSVICDIGGVLGLFFGASLLSVFEIFDFLILRRCCKKTLTQATNPD
ncbi:acid-sensing ion channel 1A-like [Ptychodera flava]|uniref:acid-sensing ion channel 1A-like n=1 Tax=Ptychodera flava TaxID=63121 RepID=UPI003969CF27